MEFQVSFAYAKGGARVMNRGTAQIESGHLKLAMKLISISNKYSVELQNMWVWKTLSVFANDDEYCILKR